MISLTIWADRVPTPPKSPRSNQPLTSAIFAQRNKHMKSKITVEPKWLVTNALVPDQAEKMSCLTTAAGEAIRVGTSRRRSFLELNNQAFLLQADQDFYTRKLPNFLADPTSTAHGINTPPNFDSS